ncbi:hypothetical protein ABZ807_10605 [Micromonospora sp. NPDC047548]|uniref:hypothetical protein n=1 Tax=Micromonospora sp. NPDC047548 TaxID=3155624 RepID=UPI00340DF21A
MRYGPPPLCLRVSPFADRVLVEITDSNPVVPVLARPAFEALVAAEQVAGGVRAGPERFTFREAAGGARVAAIRSP